MTLTLWNVRSPRSARSGTPSFYKFLSEKILYDSPLYMVSCLILPSFFLKQRHIRCAKKCSPGFFMFHFLKHISHSCYVKQRHLRCTRIDSFCFVTVFMPLHTFCNCFLAVTNKCVTVVWLLCNRCMADTPVCRRLLLNFFILLSKHKIE